MRPHSRRLAEHLLEQAHFQLWQYDAARFAELVALGKVDEAVTHYFQRVGNRWDPQRVSLHIVEEEP